MADVNTSESIIKHYQQLSDRYQTLVKEVTYALEQNLKGMKIADVSGRLKTQQSLEKKLEEKSYDDIHAVPDISGARVVCFYSPEIDAICKIVESTFRVIEKEDKTAGLGENLMGYQGFHYIVTLGPEFSGTRYEGISSLKCEIQVRTILQDVWSQISHHLVYKHEDAIPKDLKRDVNSVMSLLEVAQGVFDSVKDQQDQKRNYLSAISHENEDQQEFLSQPIDHDTVIAYAKWKYPGLPTDDYWNDRFVRDIDTEKYTTLKDINRVVENAKEAVDEYRKENPDWFSVSTDYLTKSFGFVDRDFRKKHGFAKISQDAFEKYEHMIH